ncbi:MAG: hypothetical protein DYG92_00380 [Leptolyngbya sp. PLA1]|nr:hypothetical protein [Leptolyngbya sp. PLA1]
MLVRLANLLIHAAVLLAWPSLAQPPAGPASSVADLLKDGPKGMLAIRAVQGTKDGPPVRADDVEIGLFHREALIKRLSGKLDDHGELLVADIPIGLAITPVVQIKHAGVTYQETGPAMDASKPGANLDIVVYEVTEDAPSWKVSLRHMVVEPAASGFAVSETLVVENPSDRTWMGAPADQHNRRATVSIPLPAGAQSPELVQGFHGWCCSELSDRSLIVQMPLMPGTTTFKFAYLTPVIDGSLDLRVSSPAEVVRMAVFVPEDNSTARPQLVTLLPSEAAAKQSLRMFQGDHLAQGTVAGVVLTAPAGTETAQSPREGPDRTFALIGASVAAVVSGTLLFWFLRRKSA